MAKQQEDVAKDISAMSFEDALAELETIVARLERGDVKLEDSIEIYARGTMLKTHCEQRLAAARSRIDQLVLQEDGQVAANPASLEDN